MKHCENGIAIIAVVIIVIIIVPIDDFTWPTQVYISDSYKVNIFPMNMDLQYIDILCFTGIHLCGGRGRWCKHFSLELY
jgi:hypothetical protein